MVRLLLLLLALLALGGWWVKRQSERARGPRVPPRTSASGGHGAEPLLRCAHCGAHLPASAAVWRAEEGGPAEARRAYCSDDHAQAGPGPGGRHDA